MNDFPRTIETYLNEIVLYIRETDNRRYVSLNGRNTVALSLQRLYVDNNTYLSGGHLNII